MSNCEGCGKPLKGKQEKYCSDKCGKNYRRQKIKDRAVIYAGGQCKICGYKKCNRALEFHHLDPTKKAFGISEQTHRGSNVTWKVLKDELNKCILVCSNCHHEIHEGQHNLNKFKYQKGWP